jgi:mycofactocin precursor peptide peptidase
VRAELGRITWPRLSARSPLLVVPTGSCEQHGPHLPLQTDTTVASAVAAHVVAALPNLDAVLGPAFPYGASGEHAGFPGTLSVGLDALRMLVVELGRSARAWAGRLLLVNGHGGNTDALADAVTLLRYEGSDAAWVSCATPGGDAHAGRSETSLLLALDPSAVRTEDAAPGPIESVRHLMGRLRSEGVRAVTPNGVLGDPTGAGADEGRALLDALVALIVAAVRRWEPLPNGRLDLLATDSPTRASVRAPVDAWASTPADT